MKTQADRWQALIDGETLVSESGETVVTLMDGRAVDKYGAKWNLDTDDWWSIKTKTITRKQLTCAMNMAPTLSLVWDKL